MVRKISDLDIFVNVYETGSFTLAANSLGLSPTTVSKKIAKLESMLGIILFERNTRYVSITKEGISVYENAKKLVDLWNDTVETARYGKESLSGLIKISAPVSLGHRYVSDIVLKFIKIYPSIKVSLNLQDEIEPIYNSSADLVLKNTPLEDSSLVARQICKEKKVLVASPEYLLKYRNPESIENLVDYQCLVRAERGYTKEIWKLVNKSSGESKNITVSGALITNNEDVLKKWCLDGRGIALCNLIDVIYYIDKKKLVNVLPGWEGELLINIVRMNRSHIPMRIKVFIDFIIKEWVEGREPKI